MKTDEFIMYSRHAEMHHFIDVDIINMHIAQYKIVAEVYSICEGYEKNVEKTFYNNVISCLSKRCQCTKYLQTGHVHLSHQVMFFSESGCALLK